MFVVCCFLLLTCGTGCTRNKSEFEKSAGNLKAEIEYVYSFFKQMHNAYPKTTAEKWCKQNKSWRYTEKVLLGGGYYVKTKNKSFCIDRIDFGEHYFEVNVLSKTYEDVCQTLTDIFGSPDYTGTNSNGVNYCTWNECDSIVNEITVYGDLLLTTIWFEDAEFWSDF